MLLKLVQVSQLCTAGFTYGIYPAVLTSHLQQEQGAGNWGAIAASLPADPARSAKSCRLRWFNYLNPGVKHAPFSAEEDRIILDAREVQPSQTLSELCDNWLSIRQICSWQTAQYTIAKLRPHCTLLMFDRSWATDGPLLRGASLGGPTMR